MSPRFQSRGSERRARPRTDSRLRETLNTSLEERPAGPQVARHKRRARLWLLVIAAGVVAYSSAFIYRSSIVVEGRRCFCLFDDATISMRYAYHWAAGHGPVWNVGERVEGYTNFLWTAAMALAHLPRLGPSATCLLMQIVGLAVLLGCLAAAGRLARVCGLAPGASVIATLLVAGQYNLVFFALMGMETAPLALVVALGQAECVRAIRSGAGSWRAALWFIPAALMRIDALLVAGVCLGVVFWFAQRGRARLLGGVALIAATVAAHALWRKSYYGEWLPNTYYLKATGWPLADRLAPGAEQALLTLVTFAAPLALALVALLRPRREDWALLAPFAALLAYQTYVGGDARPMSRFVLPAGIGLCVLAARGVSALARMGPAPPRRSAARLALAAVGLLLMNVVNWDHSLLLQAPQTTQANRMSLRLMRAVEQVADADATAAVTWAGAFPYFQPQRRCFDILGRCDAHIAHRPAVRGNNRAGHNKYDYAYTLAEHKPDLILQSFALNEPLFLRDYRPVVAQVDGHDMALFVRRDSPHIHGGQPIDARRVQELIRAQLRYE